MPIKETNLDVIRERNASIMEKNGGVMPTGVAFMKACDEWYLERAKKQMEDPEAVKELIKNHLDNQHY
jgi:hypothetical protein